MRLDLLVSSLLAALATPVAASAAPPEPPTFPLAITLTQKDHTRVEATVHNDGKDDIKVLKVGTFLSDAPFKKADVFSQRDPAKFMGIVGKIDFGLLRDSDFIKIPSGKSIKVDFDLAETNDLSAGGLFTVHMSGWLPYSHGADHWFQRDHLTQGRVRFESNKLVISVNGDRAERSRMEFFEKHAKPTEPCKGKNAGIIEESLSACFRLARAAADLAIGGNEWRMKEAFGSADEDVRRQAAKVFSDVSQRCKDERDQGFKFHCSDFWGACMTSIEAYTYPLTGNIVYCPQFFKRPGFPFKCHEHKTPGKPNWHFNRVGTTIHEVTHLSSQSQVTDHEYGVTDLFTLDPLMSLKNADNYELFATHYELNCKAIKPARDPDAASDHLRRRDGSGISWAPCNLDFPAEMKEKMTEPVDCATVKVPLDYTNPSSGDPIDIQLLRLKATKKPVKGSVLFNPGGPGGTGVDVVALHGAQYRDALGGHFHLIGFDPRGTGRTLSFSCEHGLEVRNLSSFELRGDLSLPQYDPWPIFKEQYWEQSASRADACFKQHKDIGRYIGTAFTARDMLAIVDAMGGDRKLRYWGVSYGTILGQIFAAMFPDRVGRLLLDANLLADDYLTSAATGSPRDAEGAVDHLISQCFEAGPQFCELASYSETAQEAKRDLEDLFSELTDTSKGIQELRRLKHGIFMNLYTIPRWVLAANSIFSALRERQGKGALDFNTKTYPTQPPLKLDPNQPWNLGTAAFTGITCSDSSFRADAPEDAYSLLQAHMAQSSFADVVAPGRLECAQWKFAAAEQVNTNTLRNVKTSFPILFVNGKYDPVTPLSHAWEASARFRGSKVVVHEGVGHGVLTHPSNCTEQVIREYFEEGQMPNVGKVCPPDQQVFKVRR
ncbi:hypothetical protein ACJ41O_012638 [Fusarium nematophilum]